MVKITMEQNNVETTMEGETGFGFACKRDDNNDYVFTQNQAGHWDKERVCLALEALYLAVGKTSKGKEIFIDGMNMFVYEFAKVLKKDGSDTPQVKVFFDQNEENGGTI